MSKSHTAYTTIKGPERTNVTQFKLENNNKKKNNEKQMCDSFANNNHFKLHTPELRQDPLQRSTDTVTYSFLIR